MIKYKAIFIASLLIFLSIKSFCQLDFTIGYFIDSNNQRTECLIRNEEWKNNPTEFSYKLSVDGAKKVANVSDIKEFGIGKILKYVGADIKIDRSSDVTSQLKYDRNPSWLNERQFLKVIIEGKASLLVYTDGNLKRFFYQINDTINQLVYKKYLTEKNESRINNAFRQQLWMDLKCNINSQDELKGIDYNSDDLKKSFTEYNECSGSDFKDYTNLVKRQAFNFKITAGVQSSTLTIKDDYNPSLKQKNVQFVDNAGFRIGIETEYLLPFKKNKWSLIAEPAFQSFSSSMDFKGSVFNASVNSIEIATGIRYYMFLSPNSTIFINGMISPVFPIKSTIDLEQAQVYEITYSTSLNVGLGYNYKRISGEFRYSKTSDILKYLYWTAQLEKVSFIVGIKIFKL